VSRVERLPDGSTAFICIRGERSSAAERLRLWIADEARKQNRCLRCLGKAHVTHACGEEPVTGAQAVAILRGMVQG
jgi:hypothetical protein